jgi:hypothetical protein
MEEKTDVLLQCLASATAVMNIGMPSDASFDRLDLSSPGGAEAGEYTVFMGSRTGEIF